MRIQKYLLSITFLLTLTKCGKKETTNYCKEGKRDFEKGTICIGGKQFFECKIRMINKRDSIEAICTQKNQNCYQMKNLNQNSHKFCANSKDIEELNKKLNINSKLEWKMEKIETEENCSENQNGLFCKISTEEENSQEEDEGKYTGVCLDKKCISRCKEKNTCSDEKKRCVWVETNNSLNFHNDYQILYQEPGVRVCLDDEENFSNDFKIIEKNCDNKNNMEQCFDTIEGDSSLCYNKKCKESCPSHIQQCSNGFSCYKWLIIRDDSDINNKYCFADDDFVGNDMDGFACVRDRGNDGHLKIV